MQKKKLLILFSLLIISVLILFNNEFEPVNFFSRIIQNTFSSPKSLIYNLRASDLNENEEIQMLREENKTLTENLVEHSRIKRDNEALRSQFETGLPRDYTLMPAKIIGFLGNFPSPSSLIVDKGAKDQVKKNMAVVFEKNLIGKINKVSPSYSEVILLTNSDFSGLALTSEAGTSGIVRGADDFVLFERVDINEKLTPGEIVLTKGEIDGGGIGIPPDFIIGKISSVNRNESLPHQSAKVESTVEFIKLNTLFIVVSL